ncbi:hypothetical protein NX059_001308 [Plenodomus lindquistii]|nr:hypothetical protein NX059_001308 [Plenodomus lindquistii]
MYDNSEWTLAKILNYRSRSLETSWSTFRPEQSNRMKQEMEQYQLITLQLLYGLIIAQSQWYRQCATAIQDQVIFAENKMLEARTKPETWMNDEFYGSDRILTTCAEDLQNLEKGADFNSACLGWYKVLSLSSYLNDDASDLSAALMSKPDLAVDRLSARIKAGKERVKDAAALLQQQKNAQFQGMNVDLAMKSSRMTEQTLQLARDAERARQANDKLIEESLSIARETRRDSRTMRGIAWVTMGFLPATFVSSFFGMNFSMGSRSGHTLMAPV